MRSLDRRKPRGRVRNGHVDHDRRRRHDSGGARAFKDARLSAAAEPLRDEPGRPAQGGRDQVVVGQGAKPGGGGMLLGHKISDRVAEMRDLPKGIDQRSACRHPDWTGPWTTLRSKSRSSGRSPTGAFRSTSRSGATRTYYDIALAVKAGADAIVLDGMQGGTAATQEVFIEHVGIPILAVIPQAVQSLQELGHAPRGAADRLGGIRTGADVAKALALGADAVSIGVAALIALGDNAPEHDAEYRKIGSAAGYYDDWQAGLDPAGISTQERRARRALRPGRGRPPPRQLPAHARARDPDARPRVREVPRPQPRARGPGRAHDRGRRDGPCAAGRDELDPRSAWALVIRARN